MDINPNNGSTGSHAIEPELSGTPSKIYTIRERLSAGKDAFVDGFVDLKKYLSHLFVVGLFKVDSIVEIDGAVIRLDCDYSFWNGWTGSGEPPQVIDLYLVSDADELSDTGRYFLNQPLESLVHYCTGEELGSS